TGCGLFGTGSSSTSTHTGTAAKVAQAETTHEYPSPAPARQTAAGGSSTVAAAAVRRFAVHYINWNARKVTVQLQTLALASIGQARSAMALAATQSQNDYELRHGGIANRGSSRLSRRFPATATSSSSSPASGRPPPTRPPTPGSGRPGTSPSRASPRSLRDSGSSAAGSPRAE